MRNDFKTIYDIMTCYSDLISDFMCDKVEDYKAKVALDVGSNYLIIYYKDTNDNLKSTNINFTDLEKYEDFYKEEQVVNNWGLETVEDCLYIMEDLGYKKYDEELYEDIKGIMNDDSFNNDIECDKVVKKTIDLITKIKSETTHTDCFDDKEHVYDIDYMVKCENCGATYQDLATYGGNDKSTKEEIIGVLLNTDNYEEEDFFKCNLCNGYMFPIESSINITERVQPIKEEN